MPRLLASSKTRIFLRACVAKRYSSGAFPAPRLIEASDRDDQIDPNILRNRLIRPERQSLPAVPAGRNETAHMPRNRALLTGLLGVALSAGSSHKPVGETEVPDSKFKRGLELDHLNEPGNFQWTSTHDRGFGSGRQTRPTTAVRPSYPENSQLSANILLPISCTDSLALQVAKKSSRVGSPPAGLAAAS